MMRTALVDPTENSLAQAEWAASHGLSAPATDASHRRVSFEANAISHKSAGRFAEGLEACLLWLADQPFDPSPAIFASYLASVGLEEYGIAERAASQGLIANPNDELLRNNLVFALANQGKTKEAREQIDRIIQPASGSRESITLMATEGLVRFKEGDAEGARSLYAAAVDRLVTLGQTDRAALANIFWAREEIRQGTRHASAIATNALALSRRASRHEVQLWSQRLVNDLERISSADPARDSHLR